MRMKSDTDLHIDAMNAGGLYARHHNTGFHGPNWLNINALQMFGGHALPEEEAFRPRKYYSARSPLGIDILRHEAREFVQQNMHIGDDTFKQYLQDGIIWVCAQDIAEYTLSADEVRVYRSDVDMIRDYGEDAPEDIRYAYKSGLKYRGWDVSRRIIEIDSKGAVARVIG